MTPRIDINFHTPAGIADPYSIYDEVRTVGNVVWNDAMQGWNAFGFDEISAVLTDSGERFTMLSSQLAYWFEAPNLITVDGPYQRRFAARCRRGSRAALSPSGSSGSRRSWSSCWLPCAKEPAAMT